MPCQQSYNSTTAREKTVTLTKCVCFLWLQLCKIEIRKINWISLCGDQYDIVRSDQYYVMTSWCTLPLAKFAHPLVTEQTVHRTCCEDYKHTDQSILYYPRSTIEVHEHLKITSGVFSSIFLLQLSIFPFLRIKVTSYINCSAGGIYRTCYKSLKSF